MEDYYTIEEVAQKLRVTRTTVYRWMHSGALRYVMAGERRRIPQSSLDAFLREGHPEEAGAESEELHSPALALA
jgi:excisionase family DNA binding protein